MIMKIIFLYLSIILLVCSCDASRNFTNSDVKITFKEDELHSSPFFKINKIVKLENTTEASTINDVQRILCSDSLLFIFDKRSNKLMAFNYDGVFCGSTTGLVGRARNEYVHALDAAIDNVNHQIYLYCDIPYQMMILDFNLKVKECIKLKDLFTEFTIDSTYVYALYPDLKDESRYELRCYRKDDLSGDYEVLIKQDKAIGRVRGLGKCINGNCDKIYVCMPFDNTVYELANGSVQKSWTFDFGGKWFNYAQNKNFMGSRFIDRNDDKYWAIQNVIASDTWLLFNTNQSNVFNTSLKANSCTGYSCLVNDSIPFSNSWMIPTNQKKGMAYLVSPINIVSYKNYYYRKNKELPFNPINPIIEKVTEDDNPLIILGTID